MASVVYRQTESSLGGEVHIPPSKSAAHRAILCAALSGGSCQIENVELSNDISVTIEAVKTLGFDVQYSPATKVLNFTGKHLDTECTEIDCGESGSSLRFLIPIAAALGVSTTFTGKGRLPERPLGVYQEILPEHGMTLQSAGGLPLAIEGKLKGGDFLLPGNISSQFISGLLMALPLLHEDNKILLSSPLESESYVALTIAIMQDFGVKVKTITNGWIISGNQQYSSRNYRVEGDWSQVAFFLSMAAFSQSEIKISGLRFDSVQGDRACVEEYRKFGLSIYEENDVLVAKNEQASLPFHGLSSTMIDASQIPDLVPALAVCAAGANGITMIYNAGRLRIKECDRLLAMQTAITDLGGTAEIAGDQLRITGKETLLGGNTEGWNDHRVLMSLAATVAFSEKAVIVTDAWSIRKSYPNFYNDYHTLGGIADVIDVG